MAQPTFRPMAENYLLYECKDFLILDKPHGMPTVPLKSQSIDGTLLEQAAKVCPQVLEVKGKNFWEGGALHRLDTATAGLVLFAKSQCFYDKLQELQENNLFEKYYTAYTFENDSLKGYDIEEKLGIINIISYFRPYGPRAKEVRPTEDEKKAKPRVLYKTAVIREDNKFYCAITKGFRHQIRAHLAWTGHPILGDSLYGEKEQTEASTALQLECVGVSFPVKENEKVKRYTFIKESVSNQSFPSLSRFANEAGNAIIGL